MPILFHSRLPQHILQPHPRNIKGAMTEDEKKQDARSCKEGSAEDDWTMTSSKTPKISWTGISRVILGSKSWSRKMLIKELKPPNLFTLVADIDEDAVAKKCSGSVPDMVLEIGVAKARALMNQPSALRSMLRATTDLTEEVVNGRVKYDSRDSYESGNKTGEDSTEQINGTVLLITGDALVTHNKRVLGKPKDRDEGRNWLRQYGEGLPVTTVSSIVVTDVRRKLYWGRVDEAEVYFRPMSDSAIERVLDDALVSAGALRIEHPDVKPFVECIVGDMSAVMGFSQPLCARLVSEAIQVTGTPKALFPM